MNYVGMQSDANKDPKIRTLRNKYKSEGIDLFWTITQLVSGRVSPENMNCRLEESADLLAQDTLIPENKIVEILKFMADIELIFLDPNVATSRPQYVHPKVLKYPAKYIRNSVPKHLEIMASIIEKCKKRPSTDHSVTTIGPQCDQSVPLKKEGKKVKVEEGNLKKFEEVTSTSKPSAVNQPPSTPNGHEKKLRLIELINLKHSRTLQPEEIIELQQLQKFLPPSQ